MTFQCRACKQKFLTKQARRQHQYHAHKTKTATDSLRPVSSREARFIQTPACPLCPGLSFASKHNARRHYVEQHVVACRYLCPLCNRTYVRNEAHRCLPVAPERAVAELHTAQPR